MDYSSIPSLTCLPCNNQSYLLLSCCPCEGRISGIVDAPNAVATLAIPTAIFDQVSISGQDSNKNMVLLWSNYQLSIPGSVHVLNSDWSNYFSMGTYTKVNKLRSQEISLVNKNGYHEVYWSVLVHQSRMCTGYSTKNQQGAGWSSDGEDTRCPEMYLRRKFANNKEP